MRDIKEINEQLEIVLERISATQAEMAEHRKELRKLDQFIDAEDAEEIARRVRSDEIPEEIWHRLRECEELVSVCKLLSNQVQNHEQQINELAKTCPTMGDQAGWTAMLKRLEDLSERLTELSKWRDATAGKIRDLQNAAPGDNELVVLGKRQFEIGDRLTKVEDQAGGALQRLSNLERQLSDLASDVTAVQNEEFEPRVHDLVSKHWGSGWVSHEQLKKTNDYAESVAKRLGERIVYLEDQVRDPQLEKRVAALEGRVGAGFSERPRCVDCGAAIKKGSCRCPECVGSQQKRFLPNERLHLVELENVMSLVKPRWTIKEFWGMVTVDAEKKNVLELQGHAIDAAGTADFMVRTFAVMGERWVGAGRFTSVLAIPLGQDVGCAELTVFEWRSLSKEAGKR